MSVPQRPFDEIKRCSDPIEESRLLTQQTLVSTAECDISNAHAHPGRLDSYQGILIAFILNSSRGCQLFIWTSALRCVAWLGAPNDYTLSPEYTKASLACSQLIEDVVASIPYFFSWKTNSKACTFDDTSPQSAFGATSSSIKATSALLILWPIYTAAASDFASKSQKAFLAGRLKAIHEVTGVNHANILRHVRSPLSFPFPLDCSCASL